MDSATYNATIALARWAAKNAPESLEEQAEIFLAYNESKFDTLAVLRGSNAIETANEIFVLGEETILSVENLYKKGFKYLFPVKNTAAPSVCECGAKIKESHCVDGEPPSIVYSCGRVVLRDYSEAVLRGCEPRRCP